MKTRILTVFFAGMLLAVVGSSVHAQTNHEPHAKEVVGKSPWGPHDEIGTLNMMTDASRAAILSRIAGGQAYDLSVEYFVGMPSWHLFGDPHYQFWLTHTPRGTAVDDPARVGAAQNEKVAYTGDAVSMYTHTGTHIDALNHFGLNGAVWNGFKADDHLGDRGWKKTGVEKFPPIIARGVLIDVAGCKGVAKLPDSYQITAQDLQAALARQKTKLQPGDVVLLRGGRMTAWPNDEKYVHNQPGLSLGGARWLAEEQRVMVIGGDNLSLEHFPVEGKDNWIPVHTYLLAQRGIPIIEVVNLEELSRDRVYEFAFIAASLKFRGASAAPFRPLALPVQATQSATKERKSMENTNHLSTAHLRVARPTDDLAAVLRFYRDGLGFAVLYEFKDHDGFDGVMLGHPGAAYHLEFTHKAGHAAGRAPTDDNLLVFYLPDAEQWSRAVRRLEEKGYQAVPSFNPYWDKQGKTFADPDGYRVVLQNASWPAPTK